MQSLFQFYCSSTARIVCLNCLLYTVLCAFLSFYLLIYLFLQWTVLLLLLLLLLKFFFIIIATVIKIATPFIMGSEVAQWVPPLLGNHMFQSPLEMGF